MENDRTDEILERLRSVERRVDDLTLRLEKFEWATPVQPRPAPHVQPPPIIEATLDYTRQTSPPSPQAAPPAPQAAPPTFQYLQPKPPPQREPRPQAPKLDAEYLIGAKILPKIGAGLVVLGLTFLVVLAYSRGWITPEMMFGLELLLCGAFVVTGIAKRDMKEEYGQILTGVGSCGFYLVFLGGSQYYKLYPGEVLVGIFLVLSLANLGFSFWRSSRAFLAIGLIGGLVTAAVLPNLQGDHSVLNAWLHFLILIPAALIIAKNRWAPLAGVLWGAATLALMPILMYGLPWFDKSAILYASTAICLAAYAWSKADSTGIEASFIPTALWCAGLIGLALHYKPDGAWQYLGFALLFGALGIAFGAKQSSSPYEERGGEARGGGSGPDSGQEKGSNTIRDSFLIGAIGVPMTVAPFCFPQAYAAIILASLSIAAALVARKWIPKAASEMAAVEFALAAVTYLQIIFKPQEWRAESALLILLVAAVILTGKSLAKVWGKAEVFTHTAVGICLVLFAKLGSLWLAQPPFRQGPEFSVALVLVVFAYYTLGLYLRTRWRSTLVAFWTLFAISILSYLIAAEWLVVPTDLGLLIPLMILAVLAIRPTPGDLRTSTDGWVAVIVGALFTRLCYVLAVALWHWPIGQATVYGAIIYALASFIALRFWRRESLAVGGWSLLAFAVAAYDYSAPFHLPPDLWMISALCLALLIGGRTTAPMITKGRQDYAVALAVVGWIAFTRWLWVALALTAPSIGFSPSITIAWIAYAFALFILGFTYRLIEFRYVSFVVIAATVGKVMLIDLATTDSLVRVGVLLALGLVMLGGGYWYLRPKRA